MSGMHIDRDRKCAEALRHLQSQMQQLSSTCEGLGWSVDEILQGPDSVTCPLSRGHSMPPSKLPDHSERCELRHRGLSHEEINALPPSSFPFYARATAVRSLVMTPELQAQLLSQELGQAPAAIGRKAVPPSADRALMELSTEERRALYDGVVRTLGEDGSGEGKRSEFTLLHQLHDLEERLKNLDEKRSEGEEAQLSAQAERDSHRRRRSYRGVHTDRRSHQEVLRDVIERQMALLRDVWSTRERARRRGLEGGSSRRKAEEEGSRRRRSRSESDAERSPKKAKKSSKKKKTKKAKKHKKKMASRSPSDAAPENR